MGDIDTTAGAGDGTRAGTGTGTASPLSDLAELIAIVERLRDPAFTRILLVTLPEATPVHEAAALQKDLRRAQIEPFAWVINQSLLNSGSCDPLLQRREAAEHPYLTEVVERHAARTAWLPWQAEEPVGPAALGRLGATHTSCPQTGPDQRMSWNR